MKVTTIKSGKEYRATIDGNSYSLMANGQFVMIYSKTANHGGYAIERFGGQLSPASIRQFFGKA